ncbi:MAG: phosphatase PAP2 family protein [Desulfobacteraceae bacterium]|nr:phosphatase PAP2 family protein [Desulfobacteraceae bacterium]
MVMSSSEIAPPWMYCHGHWRRSLAFLAMGACVAMTAASLWDMQVTAALIRWSQPDFNTIMGRTLFEGHLPGANDFSAIIWIAALVIYIGGSLKRNQTNRLARFRPQAGFVLASALIIALSMVHGLKYFVGRARPSLVLDEAWPYSLWFVFGPHTIAQGPFNASFPSGHTAQAFTLMSIAYLLAGNPLASKTQKRLGWLWGGLALLFTMAMGIARCASQNHWLTDVMGSICLGWLLMHWIYFGLLRVPDQHRHWAEHNRPPQLPWGWELMLCLDIFLIIAGAIMIAGSLRGVLGTGTLWHAWLIPSGAALIWVGARLFRLNRRSVSQALGQAQKEEKP